ncbi:MAG: primosomal protein N' [Acidobacteria bacterium]|nr:primosomal protein N' [Acidobacteriota bacterium]
MYAEVAIARPFQNLTYKIPDNQADLIKPGIRVIVPLGRRSEIGWVVSTCDSTDLDPAIIKNITDVVDRESLFSDDLIELFNWASAYYLTSIGFFFKAAMPPGLSNSPDFRVELTEEGRKTVEAFSGKKLNINQKILESLSAGNKCTSSGLEKSLSIKNALQRCYKLESDGLVSLEQVMNVREDYFIRRYAVILSDKFKNDVSSLLPEFSRAPAQANILKYMEGREEPVLINDLMNNLNVTKSPIDELIKKKILKRKTIIQERQNLYPPYDGILKDNLNLTSDQQGVYEPIAANLDAGKFNPYLLHGVTGSGKTEVYLALCKHAIEQGKTALILIPEISLTPQLFRRFQEYFGEQVALLHSGLSSGERFEQWHRVKTGEAPVVLGTRSAIFAPVKNLGIICVDEEHDGSYKQDETPRYNARDLAIIRAKQLNVPIVLGSATPSVESYYNAKTGKYTLLKLASRFGEKELPEVTIIDMREEFKRTGNQQEISQLLDEKIGERIKKNEQTLILINRRGYRGRLLCRECGRILLCEHCNVAMKFHISRDKLICHFCDFQRKVPDSCEYCGGELIEFVGIGTQRVEEILQKDFRKSTVIRMDHDTTSGRGSHYLILEKLRKGEIDILVGTQMIAKGHDYPNITLVGVVSAESILSLPDFRHGEKTFQLLTQVAGRAGRGSSRGEVVVQTFAPDHFSISMAKKHDYEGFYEEEIKLRERLAKPPFTGMAVIRFEGEDRPKTFSRAKEFAGIIENLSGPELILHGPKSAPLSKLRNRFRIQIILYSHSRNRLNSVLKAAVERAEHAGIRKSEYILDIDPYSLL